jgi:hypothetical protein
MVAVSKAHRHAFKCVFIMVYSFLLYLYLGTNEVLITVTTILKYLLPMGEEGTGGGSKKLDFSERMFSADLTLQ